MTGRGRRDRQVHDTPPTRPWICLLLEFGDDSRCRSLREYWHFEGGLLEPPPEWGT